MDVYKLLTRSTKIQRSTSGSKHVARHHLPSAGLHLPSDIAYGVDIDERAGFESSGLGTKRKRVDNADNQALEASESLDFFAPNKDIMNLQKRAKVSEDGRRGYAVQEGQIKQTSAPGAPILSREECAQILKRHKLKIAILNRAAEGQNGTDPSIDRKSKHRGGQLAVQPLTAFDLLRTKYGISKRLVEKLDAQGYRDPTEVQIGSLPILLGTDEDRGLRCGMMKGSKKQVSSDTDLLTIAPTGSGKTLGFLVHIMHGLLRDQQAGKEDEIRIRHEHHVRALILAPTHELVDQILNEGRKLARGIGLKISALKKGMKLQPDKVMDQEAAKSISSGTKHVDADKEYLLVKSDIIVSTPMMLLHSMSGNNSEPSLLPDVRFLVLDEADYLLDPIFREQTLGVWNSCVNPSLQVSLWSATIGSSIESLSQSFILERRRRLGLQNKHHFILRLIVGLKDSSIPNISHQLVYTASEQGKLLALRQRLHPSVSNDSSAKVLQPPFLVFTQTIPRAIALHSELLYEIAPQAGGASRIAVLHSDLSDSARSDIMAGFRKGEIWILITTDLLSRGIDFRGMNGVINYDIPSTSASYVHRAGRTGRQGRKGGVAVTLYTKEDIPYLKGIANVIAASQRGNAKKSTVGEGEDNTQKWLLDALPDVSKKGKQILKTKGVESRRPIAKQEDDTRATRKSRISTKSGYDRRLEHKRKDAVIKYKHRRAVLVHQDTVSDDGDFEGFED